jgi:hypothetical protein
MRPAIKPHEVTDLTPEPAQLSVRAHMMVVHGWRATDTARMTDAELDVVHADEHDDLRRGVGATRGLR